VIESFFEIISKGTKLAIDGKLGSEASFLTMDEFRDSVATSLSVMWQHPFRRSMKYSCNFFNSTIISIVFDVDNDHVIFKTNIFT
jgi:hypothetical protein